MTKKELPINHRTRVAAERREKTRAKLLESALLVFAEKGPEAAVIDDVIALAGMARGSFYNYFRTNEELLEAVATELSDELLRAIDPVVQLREDPAIRVASGLRLTLHAVQRYPLLGAFLSRMQSPSGSSALLGIQFLTRDVMAGIEQERFAQTQPRALIDVVVGTTFSAARSLSQEMLPKDYPEAVTKAMLQGLGMKEKEAAKIVALVLPDIVLDDTSLLKRTLDRAGDSRKAR